MSTAWEVVIGLEVHAQIITGRKLFSDSPNTFGEDPNSNVSFVDAAMPGMLPILNLDCIEQAVKAGLSLNCRINTFSEFARKHYWYPDLPQGYQISQYNFPIVGEGEVEISTKAGNKKISIVRIHLEQDAGKSIHDQSTTESFVDLNRAGIPLMEIVTAPDLRSSEEAVELFKKLRTTLRYIGACTGDMENGSMRCDANISVKLTSTDVLGTRVEVKNMNSTANLAKAIEYEARRQIKLLESGGIVMQETRLFDASLCKTRSMRSKEDALDYRYMPEPDLRPIILSSEYIASIAKGLPELPDSKKRRYISEYNLLEYDVDILISEREVAEYFESLVNYQVNPKLAANWIIVELFSRLNKAGIDQKECRAISVEAFGDLLLMIQKNDISGKIGKQILDLMFETKESAASIIQKHNLSQLSDTTEVFNTVEIVLTENEAEVARYKNGEKKLLSYFIGEIMKKTSGRANPGVVKKMLDDKLQ